MLSLQKIIITHFKNYEISQFDFNKRIVGICGQNGIGKTNLLDAIYYCSFTKSYFTSQDSMNVGFNKQGFRIEGYFDKEDTPMKVVCVHKLPAKKELYLNDQLYEKRSHHIGLLPSVMIAPDDISIINEGSEGRRKYLDTIICQIDAVYLQQLMVYNKVLQQRNSLLKNSNNRHEIDHTLLEVISSQLIEPCQYIHQKRNEYIELLFPLIHSFYKQIAQNNELISIQYQSQLSNIPYDKLLSQYKERDIFSQRTNAGVHKDDILIELNGNLFKNVASQGQRKSLLFALKLAEFELLKNTKGFTPILLMDDVFEKLDENRMDNLFNWVCNHNNGQVFITDTHQQRLADSFAKLQIDGQLLQL